MKYEIPIVSEDLSWLERTVEVTDRHKHIKKRKIQIAKYEGIDFKILKVVRDLATRSPQNQRVHFQILSPVD